MSPRYDVPKAAPEPLRRVQLFVNTVDLENERDWLPDWVAEHGLGDEEVERAEDVREGLRSLIRANNGVVLDPGGIAVVNGALGRLSLRLDDEGRPEVGPVGDAVDEVVAIAFAAMLDGGWLRLKACRNCRWVFYDYSPNRSATWCSMQICGNRKKTRAYRSRRRDSAAS